MEKENTSQRPKKKILHRDPINLGNEHRRKRVRIAGGHRRTIQKRMQREHGLSIPDHTPSTMLFADKDQCVRFKTIPTCHSLRL